MSGCTDILTPLDLSQNINLPSLPNLHYTSQDYSSMKTRIAQMLLEKYPNIFNNFVEGDLLWVETEIFSFLADLLSFKGDQIANEIFIDTVTEVENAFRLAKLVGFYPQPPLASKCFFSASLQQTFSVDINLGNAIPLELPSTDGILNFELFPADELNNPILDGDVFITAGNLTNTNVIGVEGKTYTDLITSTGGANQAYQLQQSPVLYNSIRVDVDGQRWTQVDYFTSSLPRNEYRIEFDSSYQAFIIFGNGTAGRSPATGSSIRATYRVGGGTRGNVLPGVVFSQRGYVVPGLNFPTTVSFRNYTRGEYGYAGDTIEDIRRKLPEFLKSQNRAVSGEDYQTISSNFVSTYNGQSAKAKAALRNYGCAGNVIDIYILVKDGADDVIIPTDEFKTELSLYLEDIKMMTDYVCIRDGVVKLVDTTVDITLNSFYLKFKDELERTIRNQILAFFNLNNWEFGNTLKDSSLIKAITTISQINSVNVVFSTDDPEETGTTITSSYYELIRPDDITINLIFE